MMVNYSNGTRFISPYDEQKYAEAMKDPEVVKVSVYRPGAIVTMSDRQYKVGRAGNLIRIRD